MLRLVCFLHFIIQISGDRPFYLFAHMANTLDNVDDALANGANAVEADLQFDVYGKPSRIYHGIPCDCWRYCFGSSSYVTYLTYIRDLGILDNNKYNEKLSLLYLDLKLKTVPSRHHTAAGQYLADILLDYFLNFDPVLTRVKLILGIPSTKEKAVIKAVIEKLKHNIAAYENVGFDINDYEDYTKVDEMFSSLNFTSRTWQGNGISNCFPASDYGLRQTLKERDFSSNYVNKVYFWTVDWKTNMRNALRLNVDGIMTNNVAVLRKVLSEDEFIAKYRLATNSDNPWRKIKGNGPLRLSCSQNTCWKDCNYDGEWCWTSATGCQNHFDICELSIPCSGSCDFSFMNPAGIIRALKRLWPFS